MKKTTKKTVKKVTKKTTAKKAEFHQPVVNIGLVGHVDHGKTTLTEKLSGKWTDTHSEEIKRGITIRLGYADANFYHCKKCDRYVSTPKCDICGGDVEYLRTVSFVDAPGHESLMATMLSGASIMDGAILMIAANEHCPQPQTAEHLMALQMSGIENVIVVQNKVDIVSTERVMRNYKQIKEFLAETKFKDAPIIPVSAGKGVNLSFLIQAIEEYIPTPKVNETDNPIMHIARSFDINKPGSKPASLQGGVLGGALVKGRLKLGDKLEIRPGRIVEEANQLVAKPLFTEIRSIIAGGRHLEELHPGGTMAILTGLDPAIVKGDMLVGSVVGKEGTLPPVWTNVTLGVSLLDRILGSSEGGKVNPFVKNEVLMLNVNSCATVGIVRGIGKNKIDCELRKPICADVGDKVTISRRIGTRFRLIGFGLIKE